MIRGMEHLSYEEKVERAGVVLVFPEEEKAPGRPYCGLSVSEGGLQKSPRGTFYKCME